jgi:serine/threonine protein kinase/tetratricopeptide (TPR) repeat protein
LDESNPHIVSIFGEALGFPSAEEQAAYLERVCGDDTELRARIAALLQAHRDAGGFLEGHSGRQDIAGTQANAAVEGAGVAVGPYKLLEQIGEGGMGAVYMADQQAPVRRRVAIKIIKPGMDTRRVIARFEAERQALALMDHPNIARVLDAGATESGRPYFVMELVRGVPITEFCDQHNLPISQRLELFSLVCQAVQHAHQKGIIHRDIKPSNVLVTLHDGRPVPKVIDFGIAKATGQQLTDKTLFTDFNQLIGTPLYMSPEQAELSGLDIDTRSDIYSLGVLLYELLTGTTPLERDRLKKAAYDEVRRIIREEEPPRPSTRVSSLEHSQPSMAAMRHTEPRKLCHMLQGDLDWIVMKALEKDRTRRYATAAGLAADVQRHLSDQPVEACPPSTVYRFGKFVRRNRVALTTAAVVLVALAAGSVISTWQAVRATRAERLADARLETEAAARAAEAQQRKVAEVQRREAEKQRESAEANFQKARQAVDEYFTLISENKLFDVPGLQPLRKELLESALRFYQQSALEHTDNPAVLADLAVTHLRLAQVYTSLNRNDDSIAAIGRALDEIDQLHRASPRTAEHDRRLAGFWKGKRWSQVSTQVPHDPEGGLRTLVRLEGTWQQLADKYPSEAAFKVDQGAINSLLGALCVSMGQTKEGIAFFRKAIAIGEKVVNDCPSVPAYRADLAIVSQLLANTLNVTGDVAEADRLAQRAVQLGEQLVIEEPNAPEHRNNLAQSLSSRGGLLEKSHPEEAEKASRRAIELHEALSIEFPAAFLYHERLHAAQIRLLLWLTAQGRTKEIQQLVAQIQQSLARFDKAASDFSFSIKQLLDVTSFHVELGQKLHLINRPAEAEEEFRKALDTAEKVAADLSPTADPGDIIVVGEAPRGVGLYLLGHSQPAIAEKAFLMALKIFDDALLDPVVSRDEEWRLRYLFFATDTQRALGHAALQQGRLREADEHFRKAAERTSGLTAAFFPANPDLRPYVAPNFIDYGNFLQSNSRLDEALAVLRQGVEYFARLSTELPDDRALWQELARFRIKYAALLQTSNRSAEAEVEFRKALDAAEKVAADLSPTADPGDIIAAGEAFRDLGRDLRELQPAKAEHAFLFAMRLFEDALLHPQAAGDESSNLQYRFLAADTYWYLGQLSARAGRRPEAEKHIRRMVELAGTLPAGFVRDPGRRWAVTAWFKTLNSFLQWDGRRDDALAVLRQGVEYFARSSAELPEEATLWQGEAELRFLLGEELQRSGQADAARTEWTKTLELYRHLAEYDPKEPSHRAWVSDTHWKIAAVLRSQGQIDQAIEAGQSAIDENRNLVQAFPDHTDHRANLALLRRGLSDMLRAAGRLAEAGEAFSASCELYKKLDADFSDKPEYRNGLTRNYISLAEALLSQSQHAEAEATLRRAIQAFDELAAAHPTVPDYRRVHALFRARLARLLTLTDRAEEANQTLRQAIDSHQKIIEEFPQYGELGLVYLNLAILLTAAEQPEQAEAAYHKGAELVGNNSGVLNDFAWRFATAAEVRFHQPRWAVELAQKATELAAQKKTTLNTLGVAHYRAGSWQDAVTTLEQAIKETDGGTSFDFFFLAMANWQLGHKDEAHKSYDQAVEWMEKHQPENAELRRFRAEAQELLGIEQASTSPPDTPAPSKVATPTDNG